MNFRQNDGDKDKFNESLHHYRPKKFDHSLHYKRPIKSPILPEEKYYYDRRLKCNSLGFNGTTSNVRIPDSVSLSPTSTMTAMIWAKGAEQDNKTILCHYDTNQRAFFITSHYVSPYNNIRIIISDDGTYNIGHRKVYNSSIIGFDNTWHLIGFTFNAGILKLYIDGVEDTNPTKELNDVITTIHDSTGDILIGCYLSSGVPTDLFNGDFAKPRIWNRVLTDAEWLNAYTGVHVSKTGLVLDMTMINNCHGDTIKDLSGYDNHGTLTDCVWNQKWVTERKKVITHEDT